MRSCRPNAHRIPLLLHSFLVRTLPSVIGYGTALAVVLGTFDYTGGSITGLFREPGEDEVARRESVRKDYRRPIEETVEMLGEGRGIRWPLVFDCGRTGLTTLKASMDQDTRTGDARDSARSMALISRMCRGDNKKIKIKKRRAAGVEDVYVEEVFSGLSCKTWGETRRPNRIQLYGAFCRVMCRERISTISVCGSSDNSVIEHRYIIR